MSHDAKCYELAKHFLPEGDEDMLEELADLIQETVEEYLAG